MATATNKQTQTRFHYVYASSALYYPARTGTGNKVASVFYFASTLLLKKKKPVLSGIFISTSKFWIPPVFITSCGALTVQNIKGCTGGFSHRKFGGFGGTKAAMVRLVTGATKHG